MSFRHVHRTAAKLLAGLVLGSAAAVTLTGVAGADLTSGEQVSGADVPVGTFTAGIPYSSGQGINVVLPANSLFSPTVNLTVEECQIPAGSAVPTQPAQCDGNTGNPVTLKPNSDGSVNYQSKTHQLYTIYALPDTNLSESSSSPVHCDLTTECVLYIGVNQNDFTKAHVFSDGFYVNPNGGVDSGANPGDGSAPPPYTSALTAAPTSTVAGQSVTFTDTLTPILPACVPSGTVTFSDASGTIGTGTITANQATLTTSSLDVGSYSVKADWPGNAGCPADIPATTTFNVGQASSGTTLTASPSSSVYGQSVTLTATVTAGAPSTGTPTGSVTFSDASGTLGSATLNSSGVATLATTALPVAAAGETVTAKYVGTTDYSSSTGTTTATVAKDGTSTTLSASPTSASFGQSETFTATVAAATPGSGTPTGTVTFNDAAGSIGTGTLSGGKATLTTTLPIGAYSVAATYGGDGNFTTSSTSTGLSFTVSKGNTTSVLSSSAPTATPGESVTFTDTVAAGAPAVGTPTGIVTFKDGTTTLGTATLSAGKATFSTSTLAIGSHSITAVYGGDGNFNGSTSNTVNQTVLKIVTVLTGTPQISISPLSIILPAVQATLKTAAGVPVAGQTITFTAGSTTLCTAVTGPTGVAKCTPPLLDEVDILLALSVHESFAGTSVYDPASSSTSVIEL